MVVTQDPPLFSNYAVWHRTVQATGMLEDVQSYVQLHFPYWNRKGGRDHVIVSGRQRPRRLLGCLQCICRSLPVCLGMHLAVHGDDRGTSVGPTLLGVDASPPAWLSPISFVVSPLQLVTHDEASCWVPNAIRPAMILSQWGRHEENHISGTFYGMLGMLARLLLCVMFACGEPQWQCAQTISKNRRHGVRVAHVAVIYGCGRDPGWAAIPGLMRCTPGRASCLELELCGATVQHTSPCLQREIITPCPSSTRCGFRKEMLQD